MPIYKNFFLLSFSRSSYIRRTLDEISASLEFGQVSVMHSRDVLETLLDQEIDLIVFHTDVSEETILATVEMISHDDLCRSIPIIILSDLKDNEELAKRLSGYPVISIITYANWQYQFQSLVSLLRHRKDSEIDLYENLTFTEKSNFMDPLTGVLNRRGGEKKFESLVGYYASNDEPFSLIMLDIDFFKKVNDTYGHHTGDEVLAEISSTIKEEIRKEDVLVRLGGEEFMVLLSNADLDIAVEKAELLRRKIEAASYSSHNLNITSSFGVVEYKTGVTLEKLIKKADTLLYRAKTGGRNQVCSELKLACIP